jgi:hypothetical protein
MSDDFAQQGDGVAIRDRRPAIDPKRFVSAGLLHI